MSKKIFTDFWGAKYERSIFGSVKGADGHNYKQVAMSPIGIFFACLFWIGITIYFLVSEPTLAVTISLLIMAFVALIRGLFGIKKKYNAVAPSNLMAFAVICVFFFVTDAFDNGEYVFYVLPLVLSLGFLIAARMKWYVIFGFVSLVLDIAYSMIYGLGFMNLVGSFVLSALILVLPLLSQDRIQESRKLHIACLSMIGVLAIKEVIYDGIRHGVYSSLIHGFPNTFLYNLGNIIFLLVPILALLAYMYFSVEKKQPVWAGVSMAVLAIIEILLSKTRYMRYMYDPLIIFKLATCALTTLCIVWQRNRYVPQTTPSVQQENEESKSEITEEQPAN